MALEFYECMRTRPSGVSFFNYTTTIYGEIVWKMVDFT